LFKDIIEKLFPDLPFTHEQFVNFKQNGKSRHFWLDFFFPTLRIAVEINPAWHEQYQPVIDQDKVKTELLATRRNIQTIPVRVKGRMVKGRWQPSLNQEDTRKAIRILKQAQISPECLNYYI
jgi:hypothetical protein